MTEKEKSEMQSIINWLEVNHLCGTFSFWCRNSEYRNEAIETQYKLFRKLYRGKEV